MSTDIPCINPHLTLKSIMLFSYICGFVLPGLEFPVPSTSCRGWNEAQRLVGRQSRAKRANSPHCSIRYQKWEKLGICACWSGICASDKPAAHQHGTSKGTPNVHFTKDNHLKLDTAQPSGCSFTALGNWLSLALKMCILFWVVYMCCFFFCLFLNITP